MEIHKVKRYEIHNGDTVSLENFDDEMFVILAPVEPITSLTIAWPELHENGNVVTFLSTEFISGIIHSGAQLNTEFTEMISDSGYQFVYDEEADT